MRLSKTDIGDFLFRSRRTIISTLVATCVLFIGGSYMVRPTYRSSATLMLPRRDVQHILLDKFQHTPYLSKAQNQEEGSDTVGAFAVSPASMGEMAFKLQLRDADGLLMSAHELRTDNLLSELWRYLTPKPRLEIKPITGSDLLEVAALSSDRLEATAMANTLADVIIEHRKGETAAQFADIQSRVKEHLDQIRSDYQLGISKITDIKKQQASADLQAETKLAAEKMMALLKDKENTVTALAQAQAKRNLLKEGLRKEKLGFLSASTLREHPQIEDLRRRLTSLKLELAEASAEFTAEHPRLISLKEGIAAAEEELANEIAVFRTSAPELADLNKEVASLEARREAIDTNLQEHVQRVNGLADKALEQAPLDMTLKATPKYYSAFLDSLHTLTVAQAAGMTGTKVVDRATEPVSPVFPKKGLNTFLGLLSGLTLGLMLAFVKEYFDDTIRSAQDVKTVSTSLLVGAVPKFDTREFCIMLGRDPNDPLCESYRWLRTNFALLGQRGNRRIRSLMITSARPEEGKTTTVANLGISIAQEGKTVLLVDTDLRRPSLHKHFSVSNDSGLADLLRGDCALKEAVQSSPVRTLSILPSGSPFSDPGALLESDRMASLVSDLQTMYDVVILDTAPLLLKTDAINMVRYVDQSVVVLESESTKRREFVEIMGLLAKTDVEPLGVVLNKCPVRRGMDLYGHYYDHDSRSEIGLPEPAVIPRTAPRGMHVL